MSEDNPTPDPSEGSIPPVEPIVADDTADDTPATTPTAATPPAADPTPASAAAPTATPAPEPWAVTAATPAAATPATATHSGSHILMPKWVVFSVVGIALAALGFGIGWVAKPDSDSNRPAASGRPFANGQNPFGNVNPFGNNGGNSGNGNSGNGNSGNGNSGNGNSGNGGTQATGAFLGVSATVTTGNDGGAEVARVVSGSPADDAGLASGDVITKVDGTSISSPEQLVTVISGHKSGDKVTVTYTRAGATKTAEVTLGDRSDAPTQQTPSSNSRSGSED